MDKYGIHEEINEMNLLNNWLNKEKKKVNVFDSVRKILIGGVSVIVVGVLGYTVISSDNTEDFCLCDDIVYVG